MLITISGMVGSGKTTAAGQIVKMLEQNGIAARHVRFQSLPCFTLFKHGSRSAPGVETGPQAARWSGYRRKRLTARLALGYALRMFLFRAFRFRRPPQQAEVMDRYFYDNFAHFHLTTRSEQLYAAVLHKLIPRADVSILLIVPPQTAAARCPNYSVDYLDSVSGAYRNMRARFRELVEVDSDSGQSDTAVLNAAIVNSIRAAARLPDRS